jgi:hypothetical protein
VPPTAPSNRALAWQNMSYAVQWFIFAGFLFLIWFRLVRDDHLGRLRDRPGTGRGREPDRAPAPEPDPEPSPRGVPS